ncbi:hypothetical protein VSR82_37895 [Burkholderia sp. JPY481]
MSALCLDGLHEKIDGIVTLSTPFLVARRRRVHYATFLGTMVSPGAVLFAGYLFILDIFSLYQHLSETTLKLSFIPVLFMATTVTGLFAKYVNSISTRLIQCTKRGGAACSGRVPRFLSGTTGAFMLPI